MILAFRNNKKKYLSQKGFSLIEFVVVLVIFSIMSSVSIFNYNNYRNVIREINVSQDIALSIRQAQVYGLSSTDRIVGDSDTDPEDLFAFNQSIPDITQDRSIRGVVIDSDNESIIIFEDLNRNFVYDSSTDRIIDTRTILASGVEILGVDLCDTNPNCDNVQTDPVHIAFQRPYPDAYISLDGAPSTTYDFASILISSSSTPDRYVELNMIGNISVKKDYEVSP
ncbi:type II secretion system protein [Patescibacteria group bacterium]|nr:type II secretion system protein [Patescibacteria group bacterium]